MATHLRRLSGLVGATIVGGAVLHAARQQAQCFSLRQAAAPRSTVSRALSKETEFDVVVVGGGIVGLAVAREVLNRFPQKTVAVLEKEGEVAAHQSGHNSGVIHAGMYYTPGSVMAHCCVDGARKMYRYCEEKGLPALRVGKLIVATSEDELPTLEKLLRNGNANGVEGLEIVDAKRIKELEPNVEAIAALYSPNTGVVDYAQVCRQLATDVNESGRGDVKLKFEVKSIEATADGRVLIRGAEPNQKGPAKRVVGRNVVTCCGLYSDTVGTIGGGETSPKVTPFRGQYYQMKPEFRDIVSMNIYPCPKNTGIPVGVHFTPTVDERRGHQTIIGPSSCIAFSREGYKFTDVSLRDMAYAATNIGLWKFVAGNFGLAMTELYRDVSKAAFLREAQKLIPAVTEDMVEESFSGVMAQVFLGDGKAASDYLFERHLLNGTTLHVRNAPSPACTSSLAIAEHVINIAAEDFKWL